MLDRLLIWHRTPDQELSHVRWRFLTTSTRVAFCGHLFGLQTLEGSDQRCTTCHYAADMLYTTLLNHRCHSLQAFSDHPLVSVNHATFEAAGGRWAALQERPLNRREIRREMEGIVREHIATPEVLLREVLGYMDLAVEAALDTVATATDTTGETDR